MKRLIDVDELCTILGQKCCELDGSGRFDESTGIGIAKEIMEHAETIELTFCKDCKRCETVALGDGNESISVYVCNGFTEICADGTRYSVEPYEYCAWAERKDI